MFAFKANVILTHELPLSASQSRLQRAEPSLLISTPAFPGWFSSRQPSILIAWSIDTHWRCSQHLPPFLSQSVSSLLASSCPWSLFSLLCFIFIVLSHMLQKCCWQRWPLQIWLPMWNNCLSGMSGLLFVNLFVALKTTTKKKKEQGVGSVKEINNCQEEDAVWLVHFDKQVLWTAPLWFEKPDRRITVTGKSQ